jgi:plastocyanin
MASVFVGGLLTACGGNSSAPGSTGDAADGGDAVAATGPPQAQTITIDSTDELTYEPDTISAKVGTLTLTLGNGGQVPHNLVFDDPALPRIGTVTGGKELSATYTFTEPGTYTFVCTFHNGMDGKVVVT